MFLMCSCGPKNEGELYLLDKTIVDYFAYARDNSWWVFSDSNNNRVDSFFIEDYHIRHEMWDDYSLQLIFYKLHSSEYVYFCFTGVEDEIDSICTFGITSTGAGAIDYFSHFRDCFTGDRYSGWHDRWI